LALNETLQVVCQQRQIQRVDRLKIGLAIFPQWRFVAVKEVIIELEGERLNTERQQLHGEPARGRGLACR
jgi:hypothetical protein